AHEINKRHACPSLLPYCSVTHRSESDARVNGLRRNVDYPSRDLPFCIQEIASAHDRIPISRPTPRPFGNISRHVKNPIFTAIPRPAACGGPPQDLVAVTKQVRGAAFEAVPPRITKAVLASGGLFPFFFRRQTASLPP